MWWHAKTYDKADKSLEGDSKYFKNIYQDGLRAIESGDGERAEILLQTAASGWNRQAAYRLGQMYLTGELGVEQNYTYARQCFEDAKYIEMDYGHQCCAIYFDDTLIWKGRLSWLAVEGYKKGNVECFWFLGKMFENGLVWDKNLNFAKYFYDLYCAAGGNSYEIPKLNVKAEMPYVNQYIALPMKEKLSNIPSKIKVDPEDERAVAHLFEEGMTWEKKIPILIAQYNTFNNNGMNESMASTMAAGIDNEDTRWWLEGRQLLKPIKRILDKYEELGEREKLVELIERDAQILKKR